MKRNLFFCFLAILAISCTALLFGENQKSKTKTFVKEQKEVAINLKLVERKDFSDKNKKNIELGKDVKFICSFFLYKFDKKLHINGSAIVTNNTNKSKKCMYNVIYKDKEKKIIACTSSMKILQKNEKKHQSGGNAIEIPEEEIKKIKYCQIIIYISDAK
jgi:hypothetical protein